MGTWPSSTSNAWMTCSPTKPKGGSMRGNQKRNAPAPQGSSGLGRRDFLTGAAVIGASLAVGPAWAGTGGTTRMKTRKLGTLDVSELGAGCMNPTELREIETAFSKTRVHGGRMNEMQMQA